MEGTMDRIQRILVLLLTLTTQSNAARPTPQFWLGLGYAHTVQTLPVRVDIAPKDSSLILFAASLLPYSIDSSNAYLTIETEHYLSNAFSGSLRASFSSSDRSHFRPFVTHLSGPLVESYAKFHMDKTTYGIGVGLKHDQIRLDIITGPSHIYILGYSPSLTLSSEMLLSDSSKIEISATATATSLLCQEKDFPTIDYLKPQQSFEYSAHITMSYNLNNIQ
jgi:hypothetical protein